MVEHTTISGIALGFDPKVADRNQPLACKPLIGHPFSLVPEIEGRVVGHVAFSPVIISDGTRDWYGLGPVSVLPYR